VSSRRKARTPRRHERPSTVAPLYLPELEHLECHVCGQRVGRHQVGASLWLQEVGKPLTRCKVCTERELRAAVSLVLIRTARMHLSEPGEATAGGM